MNTIIAYTSIIANTRTVHNKCMHVYVRMHATAELASMQTHQCMRRCAVFHARSLAFPGWDLGSIWDGFVRQGRSNQHTGARNPGAMIASTHFVLQPVFFSSHQEGSLKRSILLHSGTERSPTAAPGGHAMYVSRAACTVHVLQMVCRTACE